MLFSRLRFALPSLLLTAVLSSYATAAPQQEDAQPTSSPAGVAAAEPVLAPSQMLLSGRVTPAKEPSLARVGVQQAQPLPISLAEAVRRALANNNDIEISRDDVRFQETQIRAILGTYDPVFSIQPNYTRSSTVGSPGTELEFAL